MLVGLSFVGFGILLLAYQPLAIPEDNRVIGAWVALGVASAFVVHFLLRITGALAQRERELTEAREPRGTPGAARIARDDGRRRGARAVDAARHGRARRRRSSSARSRADRGDLADRRAR